MPTFKISVVGHEEKLHDVISLPNPYNAVQKFASKPNIKKELKFIGGSYFQFEVVNLRTNEERIYGVYFGWPLGEDVFRYYRIDREL